MNGASRVLCKARRKRTHGNGLQHKYRNFFDIWGMLWGTERAGLHLTF